MKRLAIHQFHAGSGYGDGITNGMFYTQKIIQESGIKSEIFCANIDPRLSGRIKSFKEYKSNDNDIILVHYSLGTYHDEWISRLKSRRILVYHNITPASFFQEGSELRRLVDSGRRQLAAWAKDGIFEGQIAISDYNALELKGWGYDGVESIPLLMDLDHLRAHPWNRAIGLDADGVKTLLFVGRVCEHKGQLELIEMMGHLKKIVTKPVRLLLAGGVTSEAFEAELHRAIEMQGGGGLVQWLGKLEDEDIYGLYRRADLYVSLSRHEGFGMPLVEAMAFDLPVLARDAGGIAATLGCGGLVLKDADPRVVAAAAHLMLEEPALRRRVLEAQRTSLRRYERAVVAKAFEQYLRRLGVDVALTQGVEKPRSGLWTVEGPYDSSYSLAIVNRELARGLERMDTTVAVVSRDGPGPYAPSAAFLADNPDIAKMGGRVSDESLSDVVLRNQYPPHVADMRGGVRVLSNYAWEESGFPSTWVDEFNTSLDLVTVTSEFVAKVLRDNGVHTPIAVVGNGIDHMVSSSCATARQDDDGVFRFLHVSSCFPRKGVDALLAAWAKAFDVNCRVELVIKTFANPHNTVAADLKAFRRAHPNHAPIVLIEQDLGERDMRNLYDRADCVACPSRGEGFGLPLAEAAALGKPIITTAYGGQSDFCTPETAWLCDFSFAPSQTHIGVPNSVWVEPDVDSLARTLSDCFKASPEERAKRAAAARGLVTGRYRWDRVAAATRAAVKKLCEHEDSGLRLPRIGWVSSWNSRCGIATYSQALTSEIDADRLVVFADRGAALVGADEVFVERCWNQGWVDPLEDLHTAIMARGLDAVVIQFNFGFFALAALASLISRLKDAAVAVFLCLHSTEDVIKPDCTIRLEEIAPVLARADRLLVHSAHDLNRLKAIGLVGNVSLFPHGLPQPLATSREVLRRDMFPQADRVIACFGFLLPHKGLRELIQGFALFRRKHPKAHLLLLNALYPVDESRREHEALLEQIRATGLERSVTLTVDFLEEKEILSRLGAADVVVYPYQNTQESASGAIRLGLGSRTPVACTPFPIFADVAEITYQFHATDPEAIAAGLTDLLDENEKDRLAALASRQADWLKAHSWPRLSRRLANLIRGVALTPQFLE